MVMTMGMPEFIYRWYFRGHGLKSLTQNLVLVGALSDTVALGLSFPSRGTFSGLIWIKPNGRQVRHIGVKAASSKNSYDAASKGLP